VQVCRVLIQPLLTHLLLVEQVLHDGEWILDFGPDAGFQRIQFAQQLTKPALFRHGFELAALHGDLPVDVPVLQFVPLVSAGVARIQEDVLLFSVQQILGLRDVRLVRRCSDDGEHQAALGIDANVGTFIPKYHWLPFLVWCMSGSRALASFLTVGRAAIIDRMVHHAEILAIKRDSYQRKDAQEQAAARSRKRSAKASP